MKKRIAKKIIKTMLAYGNYESSYQPYSINQGDRALAVACRTRLIRKIMPCIWEHQLRCLMGISQSIFK